MWYPPERQASLAGWMMVAGGAGRAGRDDAARIRAARHATGARSSSRSAVATLVVGALDRVARSRHADARRSAPSFAAQWAGVRSVFAHPRFWWIAPLAGFGMGSFFAIQGLWAVPWMMEVDGLRRARRGRGICRDGRRHARGLRRARAVRDAARAPRHRPRVTCSPPASRSTSLALAAIVCDASGQLRCGGALYGLGAAGEHARVHRAERGLPARTRRPREHGAQPA